MGDEGQAGEQRISIGRIPLKQVRVKRAQNDPPAEQPVKPRNPMNALVPYLDLFARLEDEELARLADVDLGVAAALREQVIAVDEGLAPYADLLPRLTDAELARLTGATAKTIRFWRLCQPRISLQAVEASLRRELPREAGFVARAARIQAGQPEPAAGPRQAPSELEPQGPSDSGLGETPRPGREAGYGMLDITGDPFPGFETDEEPAQDLTLADAERPRP